MLAGQVGASVNQRNAQGQTPLVVARTNNQTATVQVLQALVFLGPEQLRGEIREWTMFITQAFSAPGRVQERVGVAVLSGCCFIAVINCWIPRVEFVLCSLPGWDPVEAHGAQL